MTVGTYIGFKLISKTLSIYILLDNQGSVVYLGWYVVVIEIWGYHPTVLKILEWSIPSLGRAFNQLSTQAECVLPYRQFPNSLLPLFESLKRVLVIVGCLIFSGVVWMENIWCVFRVRAGRGLKSGFARRLIFTHTKDYLGMTIQLQLQEKTFQSETLWLNATCSENSNRFRSFEVDLATLLPCLLL